MAAFGMKQVQLWKIITNNYRKIWRQNRLHSIKHFVGVCEQNNIVNSVRVNDWTAEWTIIASSVNT